MGYLSGRVAKYTFVSDEVALYADALRLRTGGGGIGTGRAVEGIEAGRGVRGISIAGAMVAFASSLGGRDHPPILILVSMRIGDLALLHGSRRRHRSSANGYQRTSTILPAAPPELGALGEMMTPSPE